MKTHPSPTRVRDGDGDLKLGPGDCASRVGLRGECLRYPYGGIQPRFSRPQASGKNEWNANQVVSHENGSVKKESHRRARVPDDGSAVVSTQPTLISKASTGSPNRRNCASTFGRMLSA